MSKRKAQPGQNPPVTRRNETPLEALARRKDASGGTLIDSAELEAGRRLALDFHRAAMEPRATMGWSGVFIDRSARDKLDPSEAMVAARQRVHRALDTVGPEFAGPLIDLCFHDKGLETIEVERGWPVRSAKVVVRLGLKALARHYGLQAVARGRAGAAINAWHAP
jgi:Domain of unknown function (DUF6456)